MTKHPLQCERF